MKTTDANRDISYKRLEESTITEELRQKAEDELNETPETRKECLKELRTLIKGEPYLVANVSDEFLLQYLRAKKFDSYAAFVLIKKFYHHRLTYPKLYSDYSPKQNLKVMKANLLNFLPLRTPEGCAIWVSRVGAWDTEAFDYDQLLRLGLQLTEKALQNPVTQICGIVSIVDFEGFSWTHLFQMPVSSVKCFVKATQDSFPIRHKAIHVINNPSIFGLLFALIKPFLTFTIRNRIHLHGYNLKSLHQFLPQSLLPEEFGGTQESFRNDQFYTSFLDSEEEFVANQKFGYKLDNLK